MGLGSSGMGVGTGKLLGMDMGTGDPMEWVWELVSHGNGCGDWDPMGIVVGTGII